MTEVVLVSCSAGKLDGIHRGEDLYDPSTVFQKRREYGRRFGDHWGILSAKYGYLRPWEAVEDYEKHRKKRTSVWGAFVLDDLLDDLRYWDADSVRIFAGKLYVDPLVAELEHRGYDVIDPHRGLMSGQRESRLKDLLQPGEQQTLDLATDGGEDKCSLSTGTPQSGGDESDV